MGSNNQNSEESSFYAQRRLFLLVNIRNERNIHSDNSLTRAQGYSALSSAYHTIYTGASTEFGKIFKPWWLLWLAPIRVALWCVTWFPLGIWCYLRALPLSNKVVCLIGYGSMSIGMCNTRQSILFDRSKYKEARKCLIAGLTKNPEKAYTRGIFYVLLADASKKYDPYDACLLVRMALEEAREAEVEEDSSQATYICDRCAILSDFFDINNGHRLRLSTKTLQ